MDALEAIFTRRSIRHFAQQRQQPERFKPERIHHNRW